MYIWKKVISGLPCLNDKKPSLRTKAEAINESAQNRGLPGRVTFADVGRLERGIEPRGQAKRQALGLPELGYGRICPVHGKVCDRLHRKPRPEAGPPRPAAERKPITRFTFHNTVYEENTLTW